MSVHIESWAYEQKAGGAGAKLVLVKLANMANDDGECWPGKARLSRELEMSARTVQEKVAALHERGLIYVIPQHDESGRQTSNRYVVGAAAAKLHEGEGAKSAPSGEGAENDPPEGAKSSTPRTVSKNSHRTSEQAPRSREQGKTRKPNLPFDALVEECPGTDPAVDGGRIARALSDIRKRARAEANGEVPVLLIAARDLAARAVRFEREMEGDPLENLALAAAIRQRAQLYRERWPDIDLTPTALAKNWTLVATPLPGGKVTASMIPVNEEEL